jgi:hypothetical protein
VRQRQCWKQNAAIQCLQSAFSLGLVCAAHKLPLCSTLDILFRQTHTSGSRCLRSSTTWARRSTNTLTTVGSMRCLILAEMCLEPRSDTAMIPSPSSMSPHAGYVVVLGKRLEEQYTDTELAHLLSASTRLVLRHLSPQRTHRV